MKRNIREPTNAIIKYVILLLLFPIMLTGCNCTETNDRQLEDEISNIINNESDLPISDNVTISNIQIEENGTLLYTIENNGDAHYTIYDEAIEYFNGVQYCRIQTYNPTNAIALIIEKGESINCSIALNEIYVMKEKGIHKLIIFLRDNTNEKNEIATGNFDYE